MDPEVTVIGGSACCNEASVSVMRAVCVCFGGGDELEAGSQRLLGSVSLG